MIERPQIGETEVTGDGSLTVHSQRYQETYHSTYGALTEARHVYLDASELAQSLRQARNDGTAVRLLEIGFGLGLNCLLSLDLARQLDARLDYLGVEHDLPPPDVLRSCDYGQFLEYPELAEHLLAELSQQNISTTRRDRYQRNALRRVDMADPILEVSLWLDSLARFDWQCDGFDIIYLDAFSPTHNPDCWTPEVLRHLSAALVPGGKLVTYCARGSVRRGLGAAGLIVEKLPGPPGKRDMVRASRVAKR